MAEVISSLVLGLGSKDVNNLADKIGRYMTDVSLCFEVHQPIRLKKGFFWEGSPLRKVASGHLMDFYFDDQENGGSSTAYHPNVIFPPTGSSWRDKTISESEKPFKVAYSFSGVFLDQCKRYNPEVLDSFVRLVDTGMVEVMEQTYYHSLASLYEDKQEFFEQVKMHRELIWDIFGLRPTTFENTELIYNDQIARMVECLGYKAIFTEGVIADSQLRLQAIGNTSYHCFCETTSSQTMWALGSPPHGGRSIL